MLDHIHIQNYRLFKDLKIDKLGQVNLIAGKNNTGKTALLEAIRILINKCSFEIITNTIFMRGDLDKSKPLESMATLFGNSKPFHKIGEDYTFKLNDLGWGITVTKSGMIKRHLGNPGVTTMTGEIVDFFNYEHPSDETMYVPFKSDMDLGIRTNYWEKIEFNPIERQKVVDFLNIISPQKITQISISNAITRVQLANGQIEKLTKWGDGANRLLTIALALVNAKDKTLLIDEFEVGLHHSLQKQLWEIIFKYSKEWNIQVFITTHSQDTLENFYYIADRSENAGIGNYFILNKRKDEDVKAINFDFDELKLAIETNVELR